MAAPPSECPRLVVGQPELSGSTKHEVCLNDSAAQETALVLAQHAETGAAKDLEPLDGDQLGPEDPQGPQQGQMVVAHEGPQNLTSDTQRYNKFSYRINRDSELKEMWKDLEKSNDTKAKDRFIEFVNSARPGKHDAKEMEMWKKHVKTKTK